MENTLHLKASLWVEKKKLEVTLTSLTFEALRKELKEVLSTQKQNDLKYPIPDFKIYDKNNKIILNDDQVQRVFESQPVYLTVHFIHNENEEKYPEQKEEEEEDDDNNDDIYKISNPLVLLTGASKYERWNNLPGVKIDLINLRNLFEKNYGYNVYSTYDSNKFGTEILTLRMLNSFLSKHNNNNNNKNNDYNALIFVWCGHGNIINNENVLITSDDNKYKNLKTIQDLFTYQTKSFINKPKIFIINSSQENIPIQTLFYKQSNTFIIFYKSTSIDKGNYFIQLFCDIMIQNISFSKSFQYIFNFISKSIYKYINNPQFIQSISTFHQHIFFYHKNTFQNEIVIDSKDEIIKESDEIKKEIIESDETKNEITEFDENKEWTKANIIAHNMVNEMMDKKQKELLLFWEDVPFSMMINSNQFMKNKIIISPYFIYSFHSKNIIFDDIIIDGCVYAVDCVINGIGNCRITQHLIHTKKSIINFPFVSLIPIGPGPIDANNFKQLGINSFDKSSYDESITLFRFALCIRLQTLGDSHIDVADSCELLGNSYYMKGDQDKALKCHENALKIRLGKLESNHIHVAHSYNNLGSVYEKKGEYDKAIEYYEKSLKIFLDKLGSDHIHVASSYINLGNVYFSKGEYNNAIEYHEKSLKIYLDKLGSDHIDITNSYNNLGVIYEKKGEYDKAIEYHKKALKIRLDKLGSNHENVALSLSNFGNAYFEKGEYEKSIEYYEKALKIRLNKFGENHPFVAELYNVLGLVYMNMKDEINKSKEYGDKALEIFMKHENKGFDLHIAKCYEIVGLVLKKKGEYEKAMEYFEKSLKIRLKKVNEDHPDVCWCYHYLANCLKHKKQLDNAIEYGEKCLHFRLKKLGSNHPHVGQSYFLLGNIFFEMENRIEANKCYEKALVIFIQHFGQSHHKTQNVMSKLKLLIFFQKLKY
ncbi:hypothetical protein RFI_23453 [Reticulomyxa filosa]|uniref:Peptidase C14 caspase domain-containing protein n=1 Tax=Reticulomyxa filosa TaxID=46433 RepID=X6MIV1_RETFI|nr:hypothetical protein RFI_23453 [Reticulomyxa filosa]|eukprot:ETO13913.1 hypothetical protein RFI_23453 [Reticulomyxa filosa]